MKSNILLLVATLLFAGCEKFPEAAFYTDEKYPEVGKDLYFFNESHNAVHFEWDFGDGFISNERNPVHVYRSTGTFEVKLLAVSDEGLEDEAVMTVEVFAPTLLEIEVLEYYDKYPVAGASVILYPSLNDWEKQTNSFAEGSTDADGIVIFSGLDAKSYYVDVWEENHDNYSLRNEDQDL